MLRLLQARPAGSFSAQHEMECVRRCLHVPTSVHCVFDEPLAPLLEGADAFIIGGSGSLSLLDEGVEAWAPELRRFLDGAIARSLPGFAICFGHQFLAHHLGAEVVTDRARTEVGTIQVDTVCHGTEDPIFGVRGPRFPAHAGHSDHVQAVPAGAELLARTERSPVQALRLQGLPIYSTQFHPDLLASEAKARYIAVFGETPEALAAAGRFLPAGDSGTDTMIAQWWRRFVAP